jgi:catechol 2,3-dioxygenase-like lactoylglutathione lyase family enzyme
MARIRHIAIASNDPAKAAAFFKEAFGLREVRRNGGTGTVSDTPAPGSAVGLTDGELNLTFV